jgi:hypothetical protein
VTSPLKSSRQACSTVARLIGVGLDQARIDYKAFATNQTSHDARLNDPFEYVTKNISFAEARVARSRERRMIRDRIIGPCNEATIASGIRGETITPRPGLLDARVSFYGLPFMTYS